MLICFETTIEDVIAFSEAYTRTIGKTDQLKARLRSTLLVFALMFLIACRDGVTLAVVLATLVSALLYFTWPAVIRSRIRKNAKKMYLSKDAKFSLGTHQLKLEDGGIREREDGSETFYSWERIRAILKNEDRVFVYLGGIYAHIIPLDRAEGDTSAIEFVRELANRAGRVVEEV